MSHDRLPSAEELQMAVNRECAKENAVEISAHVVANHAAGLALRAVADAHMQLALVEQCETSDVELSRDFYSTGHACQLLELTPHELHLAMKEPDVRFVQRINSVAHIDGHGLVRLSRLLRSKKDPQ